MVCAFRLSTDTGWETKLLIGKKNVRQIIEMVQKELINLLEIFLKHAESKIT